jgi:ketosteroid isomerase-like protein
MASGCVAAVQAAARVDGDVRAEAAGAIAIASTATVRAMHLAGMREIVVVRIQPPGLSASMSRCCRCGFYRKRTDPLADLYFQSYAPYSRAAFRGYEYDRPVDAKSAVSRWIADWSQGWRDHDPSLIAPLYADDALFVSEPFREPRRGGAGAAAYAEWAFADEQQVELWFSEPLVADDGAAVRYWAIVRDRSGKDTTLAGISYLRFDGKGRVVEQRDHWNTSDDAAPPPADWGPVAAHERSGRR